MAGWLCKRCETANAAGNVKCEVCSGPVLYTQEEFEQVLRECEAHYRELYDKQYKDQYMQARRPLYGAIAGLGTMVLILLLVLIFVA